MIRVVFFGTPQMSVPFLEALAQAPDVQVVGVVTQDGKMAGRDKEPVASAVRKAAQKLAIPLLDLKGLERQDFGPEGVDELVVVVYGKILKSATLSLAKKGAINVHPSLLPRWRGPSPMHAAIAHGDEETGISIMLMDEGMDTGPVLAQKKWAMPAQETLGGLQARVMQEGPALLLQALRDFDAGRMTPRVQDNAAATYSHLLTREDGRIRWDAPAEEILRRLRAYDPWPGSWTLWEGKRLKILDAKLVTDVATVPLGTLDPGTFTPQGSRLFAGTATVPVEVVRLQAEGSRPMDAAAFLRGHPLQKP